MNPTLKLLQIECMCACVRVYKYIFMNKFQDQFLEFCACFFVSVDKHETKTKGVIYFQALKEVYYDHLKNAHKLTFKKLLQSFYR